MKLVKENRRLRGMLAGGVVECLSHIHNRQLDPLALFPPQSPKEQVQALFRTVFPSEPAGPLPPQVTDHNPVGMPIAERTLVDADDFRTRGSRSPQLLPQILLLQGLDRLPVQMELFGHVLNTRVPTRERNAPARHRRGARSIIRYGSALAAAGGSPE